MASGLQRFESNSPLRDNDGSAWEPDKRKANESEPTRARQSLPLTTFENSIQNVAVVSFIFGCTFMFNLHMLIGGGGMYAKVHVHIIFLTIFHMLEFLVTAVWNHSRVTISSFLLDNGAEYWCAQLFSVLEFLVTRPFSTPNRSYLIEVIGLVTLLLGQFIRTLSMITAAQSFNHEMAKTHRADHVLVTKGVYGIFRHPSYFGFFWFTIGLQFFLRNYISVVLFGFTLWRFFSRRIYNEEMHLIKFFGQAYIDYRSRTGVYIPFIK